MFQIFSGWKLKKPETFSGFFLFQAIPVVKLK